MMFDLAIGLGMIYFGMGFPGSKGVIDWTKKRANQIFFWFGFWVVFFYIFD
tara:strand:- start:37 stop:189 length:153 start_codon:yes stop_codon:yes gene_type:complete